MSNEKTHVNLKFVYFFEQKSFKGTDIYLVCWRTEYSENTVFPDFLDLLLKKNKTTLSKEHFTKI